METAFRPSTALVKSADRVIDVLETLGAAERPMALAELSQELRIPKSSALALLRTLASRGYVERNEAERYALASPFGREVGDWLGGLPRQLLTLARPIMGELVANTRETVSLGVLRPGGMVRPLLQLASPQEVRYEPKERDCPAFCTAMGRVLLAYADPAEHEAALRGPFRGLTAATVTDPSELARIVRAVRAQGHAVIEGEYAEGGSGVAAPVFDRAGRAVATLNLATLAERWNRSASAFIAAVRNAADLLTERLGGAAPPAKKGG